MERLDWYGNQNQNCIHFPFCSKYSILLTLICSDLKYLNQKKNKGYFIEDGNVYCIYSAKWNLELLKNLVKPNLGLNNYSVPEWHKTTSYVKYLWRQQGYGGECQS